MPGLDYIRAEIAHMRLQVGRQRREIADLLEAGIPTQSAEALPEWMTAKVESLCADRDRLVQEEKLKGPTYASGKRIHGTPPRRRARVANRPLGVDIVAGGGHGLVGLGSAGAWRRIPSLAIFEGKEQAVVANEVLTKDNRLYQHIKAGMRECDWQRRGQAYKHHEDGELLFENAHMAAYNVSHFAETRVGFCFKDIDEYGLYGFFAGNGDETFESYYRTDSTFKKEGRLLYDDD